MIYGIGTDIIEIKRIAFVLSGTDFVKRIFSVRENKYFFKKGYPPQTVAGNFAAKEAFSKALGTGLRGLKMKEIEVLRDELGKPYIEVSGKAKELLGERRVMVTISHCQDYATACAIIEE